MDNNLGYDPLQVIAALQESNEILAEESTRLRNSNRILRTVNRALREANESLRRQMDIAKQNDDLFKEFCQGDFDAKVTDTVEGGLPEAEPVVEG